MTTLAGEHDASEAGLADAECWCCGSTVGSMLRLGNHPEVTVCMPCAHFLHKEARGIEDLARPGGAVALRNSLRRARRVVVRRGLHRSPLIARPLKWLGKRLP